MPVKRRAAKSRKNIDEMMMADHFYGPGSCLLNGCGYLAPYDDGFWRDKSPEVQAAVIAEMRADWDRCHAQVLEAWANRSPHALWCAQRHHGDPEAPWSLTEFGHPAETANG